MLFWLTVNLWQRSLKFFKFSLLSHLEIHSDSINETLWYFDWNTEPNNHQEVEEQKWKTFFCYFVVVGFCFIDKKRHNLSINSNTTRSPSLYFQKLSSSRSMYIRIHITWHKTEEQTESVDTRVLILTRWLLYFYFIYFIKYRKTTKNLLQCIEE